MLPPPVTLPRFLSVPQARWPWLRSGPSSCRYRLDPRLRHASAVWLVSRFLHSCSLALASRASRAFPGGFSLPLRCPYRPSPHGRSVRLVALSLLRVPSAAPQLSCLAGFVGSRLGAFCSLRRRIAAAPCPSLRPARAFSRRALCLLALLVACFLAQVPAELWRPSLLTCARRSVTLSPVRSCGLAPPSSVCSLFFLLPLVDLASVAISPLPAVPPYHCAWPRVLSLFRCRFPVSPPRRSCASALSLRLQRVPQHYFGAWRIPRCSPQRPLCSS